MTSTIHPEAISEREAVTLAYGEDLAFATRKLSENMSVLLRCDKQLGPFVYMELRARLKEQGFQMVWIDGRSAQNSSDRSGQGLIRSMVEEVSEQVRNADSTRILVLPHLDLLISSGQNDTISGEAREILPLLYENPRAVFLGFCDPAFRLGGNVENVFPIRRELMGIDRERLLSLMTQAEARKFPHNFPLISLYKNLSGLNALRIRQILSRLSGLDFPENAQSVLRQIREMTVSSDMELPQVSLHEDIAGYLPVKERIENELLSLLRRREKIQDEDEARELESLLPRGIIFFGPPGTGKTFFAKAMATALNATIQIVSGPELKSMWLGQSEENIRKVFLKARQSAPSIIVFDELDSFASSRQAQGSTNVSHSMVNQLLTEMDGFRKEELVFIVGTTNFVESLDSALLRPGRFELLIPIGVPEERDRLAILSLYNRKLKLGLDDEQIGFLARKTGETTDPMTGQPYSGDHLNSICRWLKRLMLRENLSTLQTSHLRESLRLGRPPRKINDRERQVIAYHEAGHALVALSLKHASPVELISIDSDFSDALGFVRQALREDQHVIQKRSIVADLMVLMGGREAELLIFGDISAGAENDLERANQVAEAMVTRLGMSEQMGVRTVHSDALLSSETMFKRDQAIEQELERARQGARRILSQRKAALEALGKALLEKNSLEGEEIMRVIRPHLAQVEKGEAHGPAHSEA